MHPHALAPVADSLVLSGAVAALPVVLLLVLLGVFRMRAYRAAAWSLLAELVIAVVVFDLPTGMALSGAAEGAAFGLFPIVWIMLNAVWINRLMQESGYLTTIRRTFMGVSSDYRIQALLIAFCFGSLLEAMAGFGAPIVVVAAILMALGFSPIRAATVALFADAAGTAFGSVGNPIFALSKATGLSAEALGSMVGRQSAILAFFVPFGLLVVLDGRRCLRELWPVAFAVGLGFSIGQFVTSNYVAFQLADLIGAVTATLAAVVLLRVWSPATSSVPAEVLQPEGSTVAPSGLLTGVLQPAGSTGAPSGVLTEDSEKPSRGQVFRAFTPYAVLTVLLALVSIDGPIARWTDRFTSTFTWPGVPVIGTSGKPLKIAIYSIDWLSATGSVLLVTGLITMLVLAVSPRTAARQYGKAASQIRYAAITVALMLAFAYVINYSGQAVTIGAMMAQTGKVFIVLSPVLGWLGVAATGSDTSSNALFGAVQVSSAQGIGVSPYLLAAANSEAGALGKLISPQNLAMAAAAVGLAGREGDLFRRTVPWSLLFLTLFILIVLAMAVGPLMWIVIG